MIGGLFNMVMNKALIKNLSYEPDRDFVPIGYISGYSFVFLTRPDMPVNSLAEFVRFAKEQNKPITFGSAGIGTLQHVWGEILLNALGIQTIHVPFKGSREIPTVALGADHQRDWHHQIHGRELVWRLCTEQHPTRHRQQIAPGTHRDQQGL